jgi:hypothetical protein
MGYRSDVTYIVTFNCVDQPEKAYAQFVHFYEWVTKHHKIEEKGGQMTETHCLRLQTPSQFGLRQVLLERGRDDLGV